MKLIIGLGNPGKTYEHTRHNTGFLMLQAFASEWGMSFQSKAKFQADTSETSIDGEKVLLIKPTTFYNLAGEAAHKIRDFYKLENKDILVIHDDLALPFGVIRMRLGGSSAGNNGIKSLNEHLGENYARIRVGIWSEHREKIDAPDFVLGTFSTAELQKLQTKATAPVKEAVLAFIRTGEIAHRTDTL